MDQQIQYFYEENEQQQHGNNQYYDQRREHHNDEHLHPEHENYDPRYSGNGKSSGRNAEYIDHRRALDQREMITTNNQEHNSPNDPATEELSQNLIADMEPERPLKAVEKTSSVKRTTPAKPGIDYKTELEIHDYNISVNNEIKQLITQKTHFNSEVRDLKNRLRQSEERYARQAGELIQCKEMYEQKKLALRIEYGKRSEIKEKQNALQENADGLLKQVEDIHKIWPNIQKSFELMLTNLAKENQNLKENMVTVQNVAVGYRTETEHYKKLLKDAGEKESLLKEKITELRKTIDDYKTEIINLKHNYNSLQGDYEKVISVYESKTNELNAKLLEADDEKNDMLLKYNDLQARHDENLASCAELRNENDALMSKYAKLAEEIENQKSANAECVSRLKQDLKSAEMKLKEKSVENQKQAERDQNVIKDMANHLELYKVECEQKIKEEQAFAEKKNIELQQQLEALKARYNALEQDKEDREKDLAEYTNRQKEYETTVSEQRRTINNISKRLEDKSSDNIKLLSEIMTYKTTVKSLEEAKSYYQLQNQTKKKEIDLLRSASKKRQLNEGAPHTGYSAPLRSRYNSDGESDSSGKKKVAQFYYDKNNVKQLRLITKRRLRLQEEAAAAQRQASQMTNSNDGDLSLKQKEVMSSGVAASQVLTCREDDEDDDD